MRKSHHFHVISSTYLAFILCPVLWAGSAQAQSIVVTGNSYPSSITLPVWYTRGSFYIGDTGTGAMSIKDGAAVYSPYAYVGHENGASGEVNVSGTGSTWHNTGTLNIGVRGQGIATIADGATLISDDAYVGRYTGGNGKVNVNGAGSSWTANFLYAGYDGSGELNVTDGGTVRSWYGYVNFGAEGVGTATVAGPGSTWTTDVYMFVGTQGDGTLNISNGGTVNNYRAFLGLVEGGTGTVNVSGPGSTWSLGYEWPLDYESVIGDEGNGNLTVTNGGLVRGRQFDLAAYDSSTANVLISGEGSSWTATGDIRVGGAGDAVVLVTDGGRVEGHVTRVGYGASSTSKVTISGGGSIWTNTFGMQIAVYGDGTVIVANGGTLDTPGISLARADPSGRGTLVIGAEGGSRAVAPGYVNASSVSFGVGSGTILFNHTGRNHVFDAAIFYDGAIRHQAGHTILTADSSYMTGTTSVTGGRLTLAAGATLGGAIDVSGSGVFGGSGQAGTAGRTMRIGAGGTLAPGQADAVGTLHVMGDAVFEANSNYAVDIDGRRADLTDIEGTATLLGGTVRVSSLDRHTSFKTARTYEILSASGGISGEFSSATAPLPFLEASTETIGNDVLLTIKARGFGQAAGGAPGQQAVADALDSLAQSGNSLELYNAFLTMTPEEAAQAFQQVSGASHGSVSQSLTSGGQAMQGVVNGRMGGGSQGGAQGGSQGASQGSGQGSSTQPLAYAEEDDAGAAAQQRFASFDVGAIQDDAFDNGRFGVWASGFGAWGSVDATGSTLASDMSSGGALLGLDALAGEAWQVGVLTGYSRSSVKTANDRTVTDNYHLGLYAGREWGDLAFRSGITHSWSSIDSTRVLPALGQTLSAGYDARSLNLFGELSYRLQADGFSFEPFANLAHNRVTTDGFTETGGVAALSVSGSTSTSTFITSGIRAAAGFDLGETTMQVRGTLGWQQALGRTVNASTMRFETGDAFTVFGAPLDRGALMTEAGVEFNLSPRATIGLGYNGRFGETARDHGATARFRLAF